MRTCVVGGTFDHLHDGHRVLLTEAIRQTKDKLLIGISTGEYLEQKAYKEYMQSYECRSQTVKDFVCKVNPDINVEIVPITDSFGPSIIIPEIDVIVVSEETLAGGQAVNKKRLENGLDELKIVVVPLKYQDGEKESSTVKRKKRIVE